MERQGIIAKVFPGIFLPFSLLPARKISPQHQTSTTLFQTCGRSRTTPPISPFLAHFPTSTPKPRAEGSSPSAPAKNRRKHWVFAGFLFACVVWLWCSRWFRHRVFVSICTCPQPSSSLPAPKTHPVLPFSAQSGCVFSFSALLDVQNFWPCFCALCRIAFTD